MKWADVLVVGGGIAGYTAAMSARWYFPDKKIILVRKERQPLIPWGLPYASGMGTLARNFLDDINLFNSRIEIIIDEVREIDRNNKYIYLVDGARIGYDKLILATGSIPLIPPIKGANLKGIFGLKKSAPYLESLGRDLQRARNVIIVGGGPTGVQLAEACSIGVGNNVTIVELLPHCLSMVFDEEFCELIEEKLQFQGITIITTAQVEELCGQGWVEEVRLSNGSVLPADMVIFTIGILPNVELAKRAGLKTEEALGIHVDDYMRTSDEHIFAVGDCAMKSSFFGPAFPARKRASTAGHEARVAAANLFGLRQTRKVKVDKFFAAVGDLALGSVGLTERAARSRGIAVVTIDKFFEVATRDTVIKVLYVKETGIIIGAQVGGKSMPLVREVITLLAEAIQNKVTYCEVGFGKLGLGSSLTDAPLEFIQ